MCWFRRACCGDGRSGSQVGLSNPRGFWCSGGRQLPWLHGRTGSPEIPAYRPFHMDLSHFHKVFSSTKFLMMKGFRKATMRVLGVFQWQQRVSPRNCEFLVSVQWVYPNAEPDVAVFSYAHLKIERCRNECPSRIQARNIGRSTFRQLFTCWRLCAETVEVVNCRMDGRRRKKARLQHIRSVSHTLPLVARAAGLSQR